MVYSLVLAVVNLCIWRMSQYLEWYYQRLDEQLNGMPYPDITQFMKDTLPIWSFFFTLMFLIIAFVSVKKTAIASHLIFSLIITEIVFLSILVVSCILPLIPTVSLNSSHDPMKEMIEQSEDLNE